MLLKKISRQGRFTLESFIIWCGGSSALSPAERRKPAGRILHDSRQIKPGDVFIALKTERNDGHSFIEAAFKAGAVAVIAAKNARFEISEKYAQRVIRVTDPLRAIQRAAKQYRRELGILLIGITGSSGKTTTRGFISAVLRQEFIVGETYTNWNNHIGVPLSLLNLNGDEWLGVIEMGANHRGEIGSLSKIAAPDIAVITNIGYAHVGLFGSLAETTKEKFEIVEGMNRKNGFLLLNGDDLRLVAQARRQRIPAYFYGYASRCSICPRQVRVDPRQGVSFIVDGFEFRLGMPGRHFIYSALPAIFLGRRCGLSDDRIAAALSAMRPLDMRGTLQRRGGVDFIVDCYNANPSSMQSALVYLNDMAAGSRTIFVAGEMLELGRYSDRLHAALGGRIAQAGVDRLIAVGPSAQRVIDGARRGGMTQRRMKACESAEAALPLFERMVQPGDTVLLKGSRGMHLETVFNEFKA
ncbi:MAG: UDP-N-acetylmuramoyl-tripeptide--D-alanyl-D-alanine ligase [Chitinispirillaceae bacterium]|nr:UDP-N-acetylmuramoyl-tripeptide--D-alanyl-D-alanine ligase [Chitinispirillaceae bacterium]